MQISKLNQSSSISVLLRHAPIPYIESKALLKCILCYSDAKLISNDNQLLSKQNYNQFIKLVNLRIEGVPLQYLIGSCEFYSHKFKVNKHTLIPREETELLVDQVLHYAKHKVLDLGTGSGCIAISVKLANPKLNVTAVDKSKRALDVASFNANDLNAKINFIQSNWFSKVIDKYDVIVSNPPYIKSGDPHLKDLAHEPIMALTDNQDGLSDYRKIISQATKFLQPNGYLILEHGYDQADEITEYLKQYNFTNIKSIFDLSGHNRIKIATHCL